MTYLLIVVAMTLAVTGCKHGAAAKDDDDDDSSGGAKGRIEVKATAPRIGAIAQIENLNATTEYQLNASMRAPIAGYIKQVSVVPGQKVEAGDVLFSMQTKEAAAMGSIKDSLFPSKGMIKVKATEAGIVKTISRQVGDYVQDGDELCGIVSNSSLVFMLDVPFEMRKYVSVGGNYTITLSDGTKVQAHATSQVPEMDRAVQMERYILRTSSPMNLPEGLIGTVSIPTIKEVNAVILPKAAILSNETQTNFWVMKMVHDTMAVKINIEKGIETKDSVQVKSPTFSKDDLILISGNYGLPDTASVILAGAEDKEPAKNVKDSAKATKPKADKETKSAKKDDDK